MLRTCQKTLYPGRNRLREQSRAALVEKPRPGRDDFRRRHDLHRSDHRLHRGTRDPARAAPHEHRRPVGGQRLHLVLGRVVRLRGSPRRHHRSPKDGHHWCRRVRRRVRDVRPHPSRRPRRGVDRDLPGRPGSGRRHHVSRGPRSGGPDLSPSRAGQGVGDLFRHRRGPHRDRTDPWWVPHPVDVAGDLLGEYPRGARRAGLDRGR